LINIEEPKGRLAIAGRFNSSVIHRTRYVPAGITQPNGTVTLMEALIESGTPPLEISEEHGAPYPESKVMLVNVPPTPANGIQTE